jgi:hypothetical protein
LERKEEGKWRGKRKIGGKFMFDSREKIEERGEYFLRVYQKLFSPN